MATVPNVLAMRFALTGELNLCIRPGKTPDELPSCTLASQTSHPPSRCAARVPIQHERHRRRNWNKSPRERSRCTAGRRSRWSSCGWPRSRGVDAQALKDCVAQDPALTCKVLRVVNSSLFGLHRPVADLNQAIGLLGIKPLKLLVLGFNLPDALFAEVAARELQWYWTNTLTRAVAARLLERAAVASAGRRSVHRRIVAGHRHPRAAARIGRAVRAVSDRRDRREVPSGLAGTRHAGIRSHPTERGRCLARWQLPQRLVDAIAAPKRIGAARAADVAGSRSAADSAPGRDADAARRPAAARACCPICSKPASCIAE